MTAELNSAVVRELLASWLAAAKAKLSQPDKIGPKELNRLGELVLAVMAAQAEQEKTARFLAMRAAREAGFGGGRG